MTLAPRPFDFEGEEELLGQTVGWVYVARSFSFDGKATSKLFDHGQKLHTWRKRIQIQTIS